MTYSCVATLARQLNRQGAHLRPAASVALCTVTVTSPPSSPSVQCSRLATPPLQSVSPSHTTSIRMLSIPSLATTPIPESSFSWSDFLSEPPPSNVVDDTPSQTLATSVPAATVSQSEAVLFSSDTAAPTILTPVNPIYSETVSNTVVPTRMSAVSQISAFDHVRSICSFQTLVIAWLLSVLLDLPPSVLPARSSADLHCVLVLASPRCPISTAETDNMDLRDLLVLLRPSVLRNITDIPLD